MWGAGRNNPPRFLSAAWTLNKSHHDPIQTQTRPANPDRACRRSAHARLRIVFDAGNARFDGRVPGPRDDARARLEKRRAMALWSARHADFARPGAAACHHRRWPSCVVAAFGVVVYLERVLRPCEGR